MSDPQSPQHHDHAGHDHAPHDHAAHGHAQHDHAHDHAHGHAGHDHGAPLPSPARRRRLAIAAALILIAALAASVVMVEQGSAVVITRFGEPVRVLTTPGLSLRWPLPIERATRVDLRLRVAPAGLHHVLTRDGLSLIAQPYVVWRVASDAGAITAFLRASGGAGGHDNHSAGDALAGQLGSAMQTVSGRFAFADLVAVSGTNLPALELALAAQVRSAVSTTWGIEVVSVGLERLGLPEGTVAATVARMAAERDAIAAEIKALGDRDAGIIEATAERDARLLRAGAQEAASGSEAAARAQAAAIYAAAHAGDPALYEYLRALDTLEESVGASTRLILRTDAAPFRVLVEPPSGSSATSSPVR